MLSHLYIENYVLIDKIDIDFSKGLSVISGETGSGKSILLGALGLILGQRADTQVLLDKNKKCIIPHNERMAIVESIKYVDKVVPQDSMDKLSAWKKYHFNAMFVGSDWKGTDKWNQYEKQFKEIGVDIIYFPYTQSTSSTKLREVLDNVLNVKGYCE